MKRTLPTNVYLRKLISDLKKYSIETGKPLWKRVAVDLERPSRKRREVNLNHINRYSRESETIVVPGVVLGDGFLDHSVTIVAWKFSQSALKKIEESKGRAIRLRDFLDSEPSNQNLKIIG
ncbi:MAG: 50S ribosomal protein L18e [Nitrospiraceae bacterium]|nr:50S ribosomal protein L18e [Nitrospiraceae bacterium]